MTDKAFLSRAIDQGRGAVPADLVIKNVGLLDIVYGGVTVTDIAICGDRIVGTYETYRGHPRDRRQRAVCRARLHRHPPPRRILAGHPAGIRPLRPAARRHHRHLRSARDRQRARPRRHPLLPRVRRDHDHGPARPALLLRAGDHLRDLRRRTAGQGPDPARLASQGDRPRRIHELPRRAFEPRRRARQARRLPGRPYRRPRAAGARLRPQRLSRRAHPHRPRDDHRRGRPREAEEGAGRAHPRGLGDQGPACARRNPRRAFVEHVLSLHRRPQPARHRRGGPPRLHGAHA